MIIKFNQYLNEGKISANFVSMLGKFLVSSFNNILIAYSRITGKVNRDDIKKHREESKDIFTQMDAVTFLGDFFNFQKAKPYFHKINLNDDNNDIIFDNLEILSKIYFKEYGRFFYDDIDLIFKFWDKKDPKSEKFKRFKDIITNFSRVYSNDDPYGEEDWNDENLTENVKLDNVIKIVRLDTLYEKYKFHINKYKYIEEELSQYVGMYVKLKAWFSDPNHLNDLLLTNTKKIEYLSLESVYSKYTDTEHPMVFIDVGGHRGFPVNDSLVMYVRESLRTITPEDPYGEEDWG